MCEEAVNVGYYVVVIEPSRDTDANTARRDP
jgi:hypothetical protein